MLNKIKDFFLSEPKVKEIILMVFIIVGFIYLNIEEESFWYSIDFWRGLHFRGYFLGFFWAILSVFGLIVSRCAIYISTLFLMFVKVGYIKDWLHDLFLQFKFYDFLGIANSHFINPNFMWVILLLVINIALFLVLMLSVIKKGWYKSYYLLFPFVSMFVILSLTMLFHTILIKDNLILLEKGICEKNVQIVKNSNFNLTKCNTGLYSCAIVDVDKNVNIISGNLEDLNLGIANAELLFQNKSKFNSYQDGFNKSSICSGLLNEKEAWVRLDKIEFTEKFNVAELAFHKLTSIAIWVWIIMLMSHYLLLLQKRKSLVAKTLN